MPGTQHRRLIGDGSLTLLHFAQLPHTLALAAIKQRQVDARADRPGAARPVAQRPRPIRLQIEPAAKAALRVKHGLSAADLRLLAVQPRLGGADIGADQRSPPWPPDRPLPSPRP